MGNISIVTNNIPDFVLSYWDDACTPKNVRIHCVMVANVAEFLLSSLRDQGYEVDTELGYLAGLLHDTYRVVNFPNTKNIEHTDSDKHCKEIWEMQIHEMGHLAHEDVIADVLKKDGHEKLGQIVRFHKPERIYSLLGEDGMWEEKCLHYADKRVAHAKVVSFSERIKEAKKRYTWTEEQLAHYKKIWDKVFMLEKKLFSVLPYEPQYLNKLNESIVIPENIYT